MRGVGSFGCNDEKAQTLNQLLVDLDSFDPHEGVVLWAATNCPRVLDPALLRAGHFDRQILFDRSDSEGRLAILKGHLHKIIYKNGPDCERIGEITPGLTSADLANLVNEAAIVTTRRSSQWVKLQDFTAAVDRLVAGVERKGSVLRCDEHQVVPFHEMGHALAASSLLAPSTQALERLAHRGRRIRRAAVPRSGGVVLCPGLLPEGPYPGLG